LDFTEDPLATLLCIEEVLDFNDELEEGCFDELLEEDGDTERDGLGLELA
jgi:hypothetical protein